MDLKIENLDLDNFDINNIDNEYESDIDNLTEENIINFDDINIIYSYPYFSDKKYDYEYRVSIDKENIKLDEVKCDDSLDNFDNCIILIENIFDGTIEDFKNNIINKNIEKIKKSENQIIDLSFDFNSEEEKNILIKKNKYIVLIELYKEIYDILIES